MERYCVIMCGGAGTRFWPVSREEKPKQFIDFFGMGQTLLQMTVERVKQLVPEENIILLTNERYAATVREQLPGISPEHVLLEPARRDTGPAILWAARHIAARHPDASFVTLPSDHVILKEVKFHEALRRGFEFVEAADRLLAIGVTPAAPNTSYSYIQKNAPFRGDSDIFSIKTIADKPGREMAEIFLKSGEFLWNAGIYLWRASSVVRAFGRYAPEVAALFDADSSVYASSGSEARYIADVFPKSCSVSVDYAVMEKADNAYLLQADIGWSDLSAWNALHELAPKTREGNVTNCRSLLYDCRGCIVSAEGDKVVVAAGLKDYIVADTGNALLICPVEAEQRIRNIVNDVRDRFGSDYV